MVEKYHDLPPMIEPECDPETVRSGILEELSEPYLVACACPLQVSAFIRDGYRPAKEGYEGTCENCGRVRVEMCRNGKRICEKCHWDQDAHRYDGTHREIFG